MQLHNLPSIIERKKKRRGLGHGSGRVKTAGRGQKGQKARGDIDMGFEGGALPLLKRMPFLRGKGKNFSLQGDQEVINVESLNALPKGTTVDVKTLVKHNLVKQKAAEKYGVKILGNGKLEVALTVSLPVSKGAKAKIEKAGGSIKA